MEEGVDVNEASPLRQDSMKAAWISSAVAGLDIFSCGRLLMIVQANKQMPSLRVLTVDPSIFNDKSSWCLLHPSAVAHRLIASQLVNFLEGLVPAWVKAKAVDLSVDQATSSHFNHASVIHCTNPYSRNWSPQAVCVQTALRPQPSGSLSPGSSVQVQGR